MPAEKHVCLEAASMLGDARRYIETYGWVKGTMKSGRAVCLLGALNEVDGKKHGPVVDQEAKRIILKLAGTDSIPTYNDRADTTKADVLALLLAAEHVAKELAE